MSGKPNSSFKWLPSVITSQAVIAVAAMIVLLPSGNAPAKIQGSAHDFSAIDPDGQICVFCHATHNTDVTVDSAPLWNHDVTDRNYELYNSPTLDATVGQPNGASRLCLSCHDGTVAVDSYGGNQGIILLGGDIAIGADGLQNDHPVSFTYDDALAGEDSNLFAPSSTPSGLGGTIADDLLFNLQLECSSCHDVHNGGAAEAVDDNLLMVTQSQSQLCLTCHNM
jgi:predicted CXXCH cytochrome family protein